VPPPADRFTPQQRGIVLLIAAVQLINILDFVMVMPLGPYFAEVGVAQSQMGLVAGTYTAAACISGLLSAAFLDRFDRRKALAVAMVGLVVGTAAGGLAQGMPTLLLARCVAGAFGGPATSIAFSVIADTIPVSLRGRAIGMVMGAFSAATVFGVPAGLWLAEHLGWRSSFLAVAALGVGVVFGAIRLLPPLTGHIDAYKLEERHITTRELLSRPLVQVSLLMTAVSMMAGFIIIPNISTYLHLNHRLEMSGLKFLYLVGGIGSLLASQTSGRLVDRYGAFKVGTFGSLLLAPVVWLMFVDANRLGLPVPVFFVWFMMAMAARNVPYTTLTTRVPGPTERARFQSLLSAVQHGASAFAAGLGPLMLGLTPREPWPTDMPGELPRLLLGMDKVAIISLALTAVIPFLLWWVEARVPPKVPQLLLPRQPVD
jgi:predicted MFS family arabinose efflux permease